MKNRRTVYFSIILFTIAQILVSCSSYKPVKNTPETIKTKIQIGKKVKIKTHSGRIYFLKTTKITDTHISGKILSYDGSADGTKKDNLTITTVAFSDIKSIKLGKFSKGKTTAAVAGGVGVVSIILTLTLLGIVASVLAL